MESKANISEGTGKTRQTIQPAIQWLAVCLLALSLVSALWINFSLRLSVEAADRTVGLLVDYDELKRIADGSQDILFADMARKAALAGATGLVVRER
ncbi:MAG: serine hydroxymethyltransferase, partial [Clostridiales bacterium]|nr:serine hydroxymethyltransferase [Clostridiales bacterium]